MAEGQRLFSVKYLIREANVAWKFLLLEDGYKFLDDMNVPFSEASFSTFHSPNNVYGRPKIFGFKNVIEIGIRKILTFVKR